MPILPAVLLLLAPAPTEAPAAVEPRAYLAPRPIVVDGDLGEWERRGALRIDSAAQRNLFERSDLSLDWAGPDDASATVHLAWDEHSLYLGGEVKDDLLLPDDQIWWQGDCLELFLDTDREGDRERWTWSDDDWQICLMPYAAGRPWGVSMHGRTPLLSDGALRGVEVAGRVTTAAGYTFEVRVPFANFPGLDPREGPVGFNLAVHDHDPRPDGGRKQSYLTLNGASHNYADTRNLLDLRFVGDPPPASPPEGGWVERLRPWLRNLIPALLLIALAAWGSRPLYEWVDRRLRSWRRIGAGIVVLLLFVVFGAPFLVSRWLEARVVGEFEPRARTLARVVADLGEELARHQGRGLDAPEAVLDLLQGRAVRTRPHLASQPFPLREGGGDRRVTAAGLPVLAYGFEAPAQTTLAFPLRRPTLLRGLHLFGETRIDDRARPPGASDVLEQALELGVRLADGTEQLETFPLADRFRPEGFDDAARVRTAWIEDGRRVDRFHVGGSVVADKLVEAVLVTSRDASARFFVHGVTLEPAAAPGSLEPLPLLRTTAGGAPAALWEGAFPRSAPVSVARGGSHRVPIGAPLDTLFLFYGTEDPSVLEADRSGLEVARFRVVTEDGEERVVPLRSGIHLWHARFDPAKRPEVLESRIALPWSTDGAAPRWVESLEVPLAGAEGEAPVAEVVLENVGLTSIQWYACTGARRRGAVARGPASTLLESAQELSLRPDAVAALGDLGIVVFQGGKAAAADVGDPERSASLVGLRYPLGGTDDDAEEGEARRATLFGERHLVRNVPVHGDGEDGLVVSAVAPVEGLAALSRVQRKAAFVSLFLIVPLLLFYVIDFATGIARLRLRLTTILVATSLLPIVVLFAVLYGVVSSDRARLQETRASAALGQVNARVAELLEKTRRAAREVARSELVRRLADGGAPEGERIERYLREVRELQASPALDLALRLEVEADDGRRLRFHDAPGREAASRFDLVERGVRAHWSRLVFVWTAEDPGETHRVRVTAAAEATRALRTGLERALGVEVQLLTLDGFPLLGRQGADPGLRIDDLETIRERNEPAFRRSAEGRLVATELLRTPGDDAPFAVAEVTLREDPSRLDVSFLTLPLDTFFLWFCALALAAALFVAAVATRRITGPVEALEVAARRVADGRLDVAVRADDAGEVGRLAGSFNAMTERLRERSRERSRLDRATVRLAGSIDVEGTAAVGLDALTEEPPCSAGVVYLRAPGSGDAEHVASTGDADRFEASLVAASPLLERTDAVVLADAAGEGETGGGERLLVLLPLRASGRAVGVALLRPAPAVDRAAVEAALPLLQNLSGQLAVALENARLYRLAVVDPETGVYVQSYTESRLAEELDRAQHAGERVSVVRIRFRPTGESTRGRVRYAEEIASLASALRDACREMHLIGRLADGFLVVLPRTGPVEAQAFLDRLDRQLKRREETGGPSPAAIARRVQAAAASFPEDGESRAFLLDAAERRLSVSRRERVASVLDGAAPDEAKTGDFGPYVFRSPRVLELLQSLARVAPSRASVLLLGETGTGKEVFADLLHRWSDRAHRPFVAINCSAVPEPLLEAELFGHERGAFTGAERARPGRLEEADGGTVFLDEIGDMPPSLQAKLLRVLQDGRVVRLGAHAPVEVDIRVVAATNRDLTMMIERGEFRRDLYFRLKVVSFEIPPLRERKEDIPALVEQEVRRFGEESGGGERRLSPAALDALHRYPWPGNVRELKNVVRRALLLAEGGVVGPADLQFEATVGPDSGGPPPAPAGARGAPGAVSGELNERQKRLLARLAPGETIRSREYFELVGVSPRTGLRDLNDLLGRGLLERLGRRRAATYRLAGEREPT